MHFFGSLGTLSFFIGTLITIWLIVEKIYNIYTLQKFRNLTDNPLFFLALIAILIGTQLFLAGFIGEMMVGQKATRQNDYLIAERV